MRKYSLPVACLTLAIAACADFVVDTNDSGLDARVAAQDPTPDAQSDAKLPDATLSDAKLPDATLSDAKLPDATLPDAPETGPDGMTCPVPKVVCDGKCVNLATDPQACGSCTQRCGNGSSVAGQCNAGKCVPTAIASVSSAESALIVSPSDGTLFFHRDNQVQRCGLPTCGNAAPLTNSTVYTATTSPHGITTAASPPMVFYSANELTDAGANAAFIARCMNTLSCLLPTKHLVRGALGIAGDPAGLYLTDGLPDGGSLQKIEVGIVDAATPITTATSLISHPVLTSTHVYFYQAGSGIYRCPRTGACTPENVVAISAMVNTPYDVVNDTLFYAENSAAPGASRVLSCSVATTPASCDSTKVKQLASGLPAVAAVTADAKAVYFTNKGVSVCTDLVNGCTGSQLVGYVTADADHSGSVRVVDEFVYWVQANADASINVMRAHVPY
jgi:hypothetical protein